MCKPVGPLEVRDDDHLVGADHRAVEIRRRRHREADVGSTTPHLRLVVDDHRPAAALDDDVGDRPGLVLALVVADDRDDVALLDGEANIDDHGSILLQVGLDDSGHRSHPFRREER